MTRHTRLPVAAALTGAVLALAGGASAQPRPGGPQQPDLVSILHLRQDQLPAFHAFQVASQPRPDEITQLRGAAPEALAAVPTPARLQRIDAFLNAQLQMFHRSADATRSFYNQLSPDQKQAFDKATVAPQGER